MPVSSEAIDLSRCRAYPNGIEVYTFNPLNLALASGLNERGFGVKPGLSNLQSTDARWSSVTCTRSGYEVYMLMQGTAEFRTLEYALNPITFPGAKPDSYEPSRRWLENSCWNEAYRLRVRAFYSSNMANAALNRAALINDTVERMLWVALYTSFSQHATDLLQVHSLQPLSQQGLLGLIDPAINHHLPDPTLEQEYATQHVAAVLAFQRSYHGGEAHFRGQYLRVA